MIYILHLWVFRTLSLGKKFVKDTLDHVVCHSSEIAFTSGSHTFQSSFAADIMFCTLTFPRFFLSFTNLSKWYACDGTGNFFDRPFLRPDHRVESFCTLLSLKIRHTDLLEIPTLSVIFLTLSFHVFLAICIHCELSVPVRWICTLPWLCTVVCRVKSTTKCNHGNIEPYWKSRCTKRIVGPS